MARTTFRLRVWTRYFAPLEDVWAWKTQVPNIVGELKPHGFHIHEGPALERALAGDVPQELEASFRILGVLPAFPWPIHLVEAIPNERFTDRSKNRLYADFSHTHLIERTPDGCRYIDDVRFTPALPAQKLTALLTERAFIRRHQYAAKPFRTDPQATGVAVLRVDKPTGD